MNKLEKMKQLIERDVALDSGLKVAGLDDDIRHLYVESMALFCLSIIEAGEKSDSIMSDITTESEANGVCPHPIDQIKRSKKGKGEYQCQSCKTLVRAYEW